MDIMKTTKMKMYLHLVYSSENFLKINEVRSKLKNIFRIIKVL